MFDQASDLRAMFQGRREAEQPGAMIPGYGRTYRALAVTGGKGGVGKTALAINLAVAFAKLGRRVLLLDLDLGLANADILLNVKPRGTLAHVIRNECRLRDVISPAPGGFFLIPGANGLAGIADLDEDQRNHLLQQFDELEGLIDLLLLDTGAGIHRNTLAFAAAADDALVVTTPDPHALVDAYSVMKLLGRENHYGTLRILINQAESQKSGEALLARLMQLATSMSGLHVERGGVVLADQAMRKSVMKREVLMLQSPEAPAARCLQRVAQDLLLADPGLSPETREALLSGGKPGTWLKRILKLFGKMPQATGLGVRGKNVCDGDLR